MLSKRPNSCRALSTDWIAASKALVAAFPRVSYGHEVYGESLASLHLYADAVVELMRAIELCPK